MRNPRINNLLGRRFGRLRVMGLIKRRPDNPHAEWLCVCDCGNAKSVYATNLKRGLTTSCGCKHKEVVTKHGASKSAEHSIWVGMRERCGNPNRKAYRNYGARGISVCDRWNDFAAFFADMGPRPTPRHTIERIDNNGPYDPRNCVWATRVEQCNNTRKSLRVSYRDKPVTIRQLASMLGLTYMQTWHRHRNGQL